MCKFSAGSNMTTPLMECGTIIEAFTRSRCNDLQVLSRQQLYQAVQHLQPSSQQHPSYSDWQQVAQTLEQRWPFSPESRSWKESDTGIQVHHTLLQLGYQALLSYECGDGLHKTDIALLPQSGIPVKVAVEVDGESHFLYEDSRLQRSPKPATR